MKDDDRWRLYQTQMHRTPFGFWSYTVLREDGSWVGGGGCSSKKRAKSLMAGLILRDLARFGPARQGS